MSDAPLLPYVRFPATAPALPCRQPDDPGGPAVVARASLSSQSDLGVRLAGVTQTGAPVAIQITIVAPGIVRVLLETQATDPDRTTLALKDITPPAQVAVERTAGQVMLRSELVSVRVTLEPFHIAFMDPAGEPILSQDNSTTLVTDLLAVLPFGYSEVNGRRVAFHDSFACAPDEHFYGLGEQFTNFDKRGQRVVMWTYDAYGAHGPRAYKPVPFFVSSRGYGIFVDSTSAVNFDLAAGNHEAISIAVPDSALDYYVMVGPELKSVIGRYADLVSHPILPPKWSLGLWMSSGFKDDNADEVLRRARQLREHAIPCDVLHLDCYWQRFGRWSEMLWDHAMFPDPEGLIREVKSLGFKVCLWMNPYLGTESERFVEGSEKGYLLRTAQGVPYVCQLWGNYHPPVGIIDLTNPAAADWMRALLRPLLRMGVDVFKTDFGEGVPADAVAHNGMTGAQLHNLYPLLYNDLVAGVTAQETGHAGLVWGRATYAGGQRHAAQWSGDPNCTYSAMASTLRAGLSMAMCGHAFWSHDIGGFHRQPTPELYVRWAQFGLLSPMSRAHGMTSRLPWDYGDDALRIFRDSVRLRYRLLPYLYTCAGQSAETGLPLMRPMALEYPDDPNTVALDLQYMLGPDILVAPAYSDDGRRPVYLPAGLWIDYWTHTVYSGPRTLKVEAPLDRLPLYVRADAIIPTIEPPECVTDEPFEFVTCDAYLVNQGRCELRDTDGVTRMSVALTGGGLDVRVEGVKRRLGLRAMLLDGAPRIDHVTLNGAPMTQREHVIPEPSAAPGWAFTADGGLLAVIGR